MHPLWDQLSSAGGARLSEPQQAMLRRYIDLLLEANQRMNLTRIEERASAEVLHVGDALTLLAHLPREGHRLADVGSGGGVPGIPLAIARPDAEITLVESTKKKAEFLSETIAALGLENVRVFPDRVEALGRGLQRERFDVATARALAPMSVLLEWCLPLVKKGGKVLAMKGAKAAEELAGAETALRVLNAARPVVHAVELPGAEQHVIIEVGKLGRTDPKYPRDPALVKKRPL